MSLVCIVSIEQRQKLTANGLVMFVKSGKVFFIVYVLLIPFL